MVMLALAVSACSSDAYDTGDGSLSYMRADFVKAVADHDGKFTAAITDDDLSLTPQRNRPARQRCALWRLAGC